MNDNDNLWKLIAAGDLLPAEDLLELQSEFIRNPPTHQDLLKWLVGKTAITGYHAKVFEAGHNGPFQYGDYQVQERVAKGHFEGGFFAKHVASKHPVVLSFFSGDDVDLRWKSLNRAAIACTQFASPYIVRCFEAVDTGEFKFMVLEDFRSKPLTEVLARTGHLKPKSACDVIRRIGLALQTIHQTGNVHGHVATKNVWVAENGNSIKLFLDPDYQFVPLITTHQDSSIGGGLVDYSAPELAGPNSHPDVLTDIYALGCLFYELLVGKPPFPIGDVQERIQQHATQRVKPLENLGYDKKLAQFVYFMMAKDRSLRFQTMADVLKQLDALPDPGNTKPNAPPQPKTFAKFDQAIRATQSNSRFESPPTPPVVASPAGTGIGGSASQVPTMDPSDPPGANVNLQQEVRPVAAAATVPSSADAVGSNFQQSSNAGMSPAVNQSAESKIGLTVSEDDKSATTSFRQRQKSSIKKTLIPIGITLLVLAIPGIFLFVKYRDQFGSQTAADSKDVEDGEDQPGHSEGKNKPDDGKNKSEATTNQFVVDDQRTLWETPTAGDPVVIDLVPAGMRLMLRVRGAELFSNDTENLVARSLGPDFAEKTSIFSKAAGISWKEAETLAFSIHDNNVSGQDQLLGSFLVEPVDKKPLVYWLAKWGDCSKQETAKGTYYNSSNGWSYYSPDQDSEIHQFLVAPESLITDLLDNGGVLLSAGVSRLLRNTDSRRQVNLIVTPADLTSPSGRTLFVGQWAGILDLMNWIIGGDDQIQAAYLSVHLDQGDAYFEAGLNPQLAKDPFTLADELRGRIQAAPALVDNLMLDIDPDRHWKKVAREIPDWIKSFSKSTRVGVEEKMTILNCWQEDFALHNLLGGLEYTLAFADGSGESGPVVTPTSKTPQTIEELLGTVRNIEIGNDDLNVAVDKIVEEIKDDFPKLPFDFTIQINGTHLMEDGITKNQRLVDFKVDNKSLGDILAEFVFRANPDKTSTGPNDPKTKLIWVVLNPAPSDPSKKSVLITTRKAAAREGYTLPKQFVPQ